MFDKIHFTAEYFVSRQTYNGWEIPLRTIDNHELVFVTKGEGELFIKGKKHNIYANTLIYFYPNQPHSLRVNFGTKSVPNIELMSAKADRGYTDENPMHFYGLHFSFSENKDKLPLPDITLLENSVKINEFFKELNFIHKQKNYMHEWQKNIILNQILMEIFLSINKDAAPANSLRIRKVIEYIHSKPYDKFTIDELSFKANMKKSLFIKLFKEVTGFTPLKYCTKLKLDYAKDLILNQKELPVSFVAKSCGFEDPLYFSKSFKKYVGVSPTKFKDMCE